MAQHILIQSLTDRRHFREIERVIRNDAKNGLRGSFKYEPLPGGYNPLGYAFQKSVKPGRDRLWFEVHTSDARGQHITAIYWVV